MRSNYTRAPNEDSFYICDRLRENRAQRGVRKYQEKIDQFLKNVLFQADGREFFEGCRIVPGFPIDGHI